MQIRRVHHVQITVPKGQEPAARAFYIDVLGLKEIPKPATMAASGGFWFLAGNSEMHIGTENAAIDRSITKAHVAYEVDDLPALMTHLRNKGVKLEDAGPEYPSYDRIKLHDPFGNQIELISPK